MASPETPVPNGAPSKRYDDKELERKRARDRKSQQAMRDRHKWAIKDLTQSNDALTKTVSEKETENASLRSRLMAAESELDLLRGQNAALRLQLLGQRSPVATPSSPSVARWQMPPKNVPPTCLSDQILQDFLMHGRQGKTGNAGTPDEQQTVFAERPNLCSLLDKSHRASDALSNIAADIVRSYTEVDTLPNQVAAFCNIAYLIKWQMQMDQDSWQRLAPCLRPITEQLITPHASWIDRIPWPRVRKYLLNHPLITLDDFAAAYSSGFEIEWPYKPELVIVDATPSSDKVCRVLHASPVYEEHMRQLRHWNVSHAFRSKFPEMAALIDLDIKPQEWERLPTAG